MPLIVWFIGCTRCLVFVIGVTLGWLGCQLRVPPEQRSGERRHQGYPRSGERRHTTFGRTSPRRCFLVGEVAARLVRIVARRILPGIPGRKFFAGVNKSRVGCVEYYEVIVRSRHWLRCDGFAAVAIRMMGSSLTGFEKAGTAFGTGLCLVQACRELEQRNGKSRHPVQSATCVG